MMTFDIIVPYRDRADHLAKFIPHYKHLFPQANIIVVEQDDQEPFNRGFLLNIGYLHSKSAYIIFHDIDMILASGQQHYLKPAIRPTMLATHVQQFGYRMPFKEYFGGVTMFSALDFESVDGYCNLFTGWGSEDNELYDRVKERHEIDYRNCYYNSLPHERPYDGFCLPPDHPNYILWKQGRPANSGLSSILSTPDIQVLPQPGYALIKVQSKYAKPA